MLLFFLLLPSVILTCEPDYQLFSSFSGQETFELVNHQRTSFSFWNPDYLDLERGFKLNFTLDIQKKNFSSLEGMAFVIHVLNFFFFSFHLLLPFIYDFSPLSPQQKITFFFSFLTLL